MLPLCPLHYCRPLLCGHLPITTLTHPTSLWPPSCCYLSAKGTESSPGAGGK